MYKVTSTIFLLVFALKVLAQNPHGANLKLDCASCHSPAGWAISAEYWKNIELGKQHRSRTTGFLMPLDSTKFHHNKTNFPLTGRHANVDCRDCHESLVFEKTKTDCNSCHLDIHQQTVGNDCARCHTTNNWLIDDVQKIHLENGFPLVGLHKTVSCEQCHTSETALRFDRIGNECVDCHLADFNNSTNPNHPQAGFSTNCIECHDPNVADWNTDKVDHAFFPLTKGHEISDCTQCHTGGDFANTPNNCAACHQPDFEGTTNPNHVQANFTNDCAQCHTTDLDWNPAQFLAHDGQYFPIYSGSHKGVWNECTECHMNPSNFAENSCTVCHVNPETDDGHTGVVGYVYENSACLACHPTGEADGAFNHNSTAFPLTGAHLTVDCEKCHVGNVYTGTPTECAACHTTDFNQTANPNHTSLGLSNDCASCHTTDPGWSPATFANHNDFYGLNGAHATIANDCASCHNGNYNNTPNTCAGCHTPDFNATTDPNHVANQFPQDCATCHSETAWAPSNFDHNAVWPFTGSHIAVANECAQCHINGNYTTTPTDCAGCHTPDFNGSTNPSHVALNLPNDCAMCHTTVPDWTPATFPLHNDFYVLTGAHATIANDCAACHNGNYNNTPNTCFGCHSADYSATTNPNHAQLQFSQDCATCHSETTWSPATFDHDAQYFPIYSGAHNGEWNACTDCHTNPSDYTQFTCTTCHANPETNNQHQGVGGYVYQSDACLACHPTGDANNIFDHNTVWPLTGGHQNVDCLDCHVGGVFQGTPTDCAACHTTDFNGSANPPHVALNIPTDCATCHTTAPGWAPASFPIHNDFYPLNGAHATIANDCAECHTGGNYTNTPNTCIGCHTPDFNSASDPNHVANQFPNDCATCHSETAWVPSTFDHNAVWPFTGSHIAVANECAQCHIGGNYTTTPTDCAGCHTPDFSASQNPNHVALNLPNDCAMCHTTVPDWQPSTFPIHNDFYVLNGAHATIANDCAACHNGNYTNTPTTCVGCHQSDYNGTTNPNHQSAQFPTDCASCHSETAWVPATFDHDGQYFPIYSGAHNGEWNACVDCHANPANYAEVTCTTCHANPETNNQHNGVPGYTYSSPACLSCHPTGDANNTFDHATVWPLTGGHTTAECFDCHVGGNFQNTPTDCAACHAPDFNQSQNPPHVALNLPNDCASCHTTAPGWAPATFAIHNQFYPLNGAHETIQNDCAGCHNGNYNNTPNTCVGCHQPDFNGASDPNHVTNQFPNDCATCHSETAWVPSTFDHNGVWPFTGAHIAVSNECAQCHVGGNYSNTPNTCNGCHTPDFNQSQNPPHVALNLPNDCAMCHTTVPDWQPATFPIHNDFYPLNGAHATIANDCAACHNGNYTNTPNTCFACHTADYNGTTNPNHQQAGFSTDCTTCHSETAWVPANFDHDSQYFPIYSGSHNGEWSQCTECHNNPNNFAEFTCTTCHANPETNNQHNGVNGYQYNSDACFACHPTGEGQGGFDHNTVWPLTGGHQNVDCTQCHANGYQGTPTNCDACHMPDYNGSANPDHEALNFPVTCDDCHTTAPGWSPATFAIHDQFYPLTGAHQPIANDCAACHIGGNYNNTPNTCAGCHTPDYNGSTNPNHVALNLPTDCAQCHTTAPDWQPASFPIHDQFWTFQGAHVGVQNDCAACHNGNYNNTPTTCVGCHQADYNGTTNPDHQAANFPTTCDDCHTQSAWVPANFDHDQFWPITGAHIPIENQCAECHVGGNYSNTPNTCDGCHMPDYNGSSNPNHQALNIPTDCDQCHTTAPDWQPATFPIHAQFWPFVGAHATVQNDCALCHPGGNYNNTPNTCVGCHQADYNGATNPDHQANNFPNTCEDCHGQTAWVPATFNHNGIWPLTGAHVPIQNDCAACHNGNYNNTPNTCEGCHTTDYNGSTNPNHQVLNIPTDCDNCHTTAPDWQPATFPIHGQFWPFQGAHIGVQNDCAACHNGNYNNTPNTCFGCHAADYNSTSNPNHAANQFPTTCEDCHTQLAWVPSTFDHNQFYPFTGAHLPIQNDCAACHNGNYNNTPNTCEGCHMPDYNSSSNPNHQALNIPTDCDNCHTTNPDWNPATFPIHNQFWPFQGAHVAIQNDCVECHNGNYNSTPNTCYGCHQSDYNGTNNPDHQSAGFPTDCTLCHSQNAWEPSNFDHDDMYFPIYSGKHDNEWDQCVECHIGGNYNSFSCIDCHEHDNQQEVNQDHQGVNGYQYSSPACYNCHPDGSD